MRMKHSPLDGPETEGGSQGSKCAYLLYFNDVIVALRWM
jgi:hypothetical protein